MLAKHEMARAIYYTTFSRVLLIVRKYNIYLKQMNCVLYPYVMKQHKNKTISYRIGKPATI